MRVYKLVEFRSRTGGNGCIGKSDSLFCLPWADCDALDTYSVERDGIVLAEFEGCDVWACRDWLRNNEGYDGRDGVKAWRGICAWCDKALVDGHCDCPDGRDCADWRDATD